MLGRTEGRSWRCRNRHMAQRSMSQHLTIRGQSIQPASRTLDLLWAALLPPALEHTLLFEAAQDWVDRAREEAGVPHKLGARKLCCDVRQV